jgi:hypothetical protein
MFINLCFVPPPPQKKERLFDFGDGNKSSEDTDLDDDEVDVSPRVFGEFFREDFKPACLSIDVDS